MLAAAATNCFTSLRMALGTRTYELFGGLAMIDFSQAPKPRAGEHQAIELCGGGGRLQNFWSSYSQVAEIRNGE